MASISWPLIGSRSVSLVAKLVSFLLLFSSEGILISTSVFILFDEESDSLSICNESVDLHSSFS